MFDVCVQEFKLFVSVLVRDWEGKVIATFVDLVIYMDPQLVEAFLLLSGIHMAMDMNLKFVVFEGDY